MRPGCLCIHVSPGNIDPVDIPNQKNNIYGIPYILNLREPDMTTAPSINAGATAAAAEITAQFFRGLADATRVRILMILLRDGPTRVGDLVDEIDAPQGRISNHLSCLRTCGFVTSSRDGRNVLYEVSDPRIGELMRLGDAVVAGNAERILECQVTRQ